MEIKDLEAVYAELQQAAHELRLLVQQEYINSPVSQCLQTLL